MARPERLFPEIEKLPSWIKGERFVRGGVPTEALPSPAQRSALVWKNWFQQSTSVLRHGNNEALRSGEIRNGRRPGAVAVEALFFIFVLVHANGARFQREALHSPGRMTVPDNSNLGSTSSRTDGNGGALRLSGLLERSASLWPAGGRINPSAKTEALRFIAVLLPAKRLGKARETGRRKEQRPGKRFPLEWRRISAPSRGR